MDSITIRLQGELNDFVFEKHHYCGAARDSVGMQYSVKTSTVI